MEQRLKEISLHLLDLGKRNRLINYKSVGYRNIEVYNANVDAVFQKITSGTTLSIFQIDPVLQKYHSTIDGTQENVEEYSIFKVKDIIEPLLKANDLFCYKQGYSLQKILKALYREYKTTLLEKGINTLYMTFGMVEYKEKKETYFAPLLLIPLEFVMDGKGFKIRFSEDEVTLNPTLAYLLEMEYQIRLEEYNDELSFQEYMSKIKDILSAHALALHQNSTIGIYSFLKMNMFKDLTDHQELVLNNQNILMLLGDEQQRELELTKAPIYPVVNADESQLEAIKYAAAGASFVLQGPPGTGKSQTITNIIASMIGNGKKVLFVSEKQAALNVVYENLKRAGLDSFSIELHSHKANKKEFIDELYKTAILPRYDIKNDAFDIEKKYTYLSSVLEEYRTKLHQQIDRLHQSVYELYSAYLKVGKSPLSYPLENIEKLQIEDLEKITHDLEQYSMLASTLGFDYHQGPFFGFTCTDTYYIRFEAKQDFEALYSFYLALDKIKGKLMETLPFSIKSYKNIVDAMPYLDRIIQINYFLPDYFIPEQREKLCKRISKYKQITETLQKSTLKNFLDLCILRMEGLEVFVEEFERQSQRPLKLLFPSYRRIKKEVGAFTKLKMKDADIVIKLKEALEYRKNSILLKKLLKRLPNQYRPFEYDSIYHDAQDLKDLPFTLQLTEESYSILKQKLMDISIAFKKIPAISFSKYIEKFDQQIIHFIEGDLSFILDKLGDMMHSLELLEAHAQRLEILKRIQEYQLLPFLDLAIEHRISPKRLNNCFAGVFYEANIVYEQEHEPILKTFSSLGIEQIVEEFKECDQTHLEANKAYIISKLSNCRPDESIVLGSKFSLLVKEYNKSRKQKPIRLLLEEIFDFILDIKPVFLMSPLSVSTYLNSKLNLFDAVIFDEASQVFAWDALGAIYRAKQCIIIGDSKQMPPSNFFTSMVEDDSDYENEMESILDKGSTVFPTKRLYWHYRSRSEELIAFSNQNFYDSKLITIPQAKPHSKGFGIEFHYVLGTYEVKARTNKIEAKYIVDLIFEHIKTRPNVSLGVVAFSTAQADLIADWVEERLEAEPQCRFFFEEDKKEPFFVKNLESVQGDERDVILFSICFGYTEEHKFYQRFGPLNTMGGERRLNVAITRAKENVCVVSSIRSSDIKLDQTESVGVAMLKRYLEYAENITTPQHTYADTTDGVLQAIESFLISAGYTVKKQIGTSKFKIDLAVTDQKNPEHKVAIMLDGPSYLIGNCSDANALQEKLLLRLDWKFIRVFSTQWIYQEKLEKERILSFLKNCFQGKAVIEEDTSNKDTFLVEIEDDFDASFAAYPYVEEDELVYLYNHKKPVEVIRHVISKEEPIHIDYLLKRICFMYGRTKVTGLVKEYFEKDIENLDLYKDGDFLSLHPIVPIGLRIPSNRSLEHIHIEELKDAIYKIVKKSNGITKEGCFKKVIALLGYNRMSEHAVQILDQALVHLKLDGKVVEKQNCLFI